MSQNDDAQILDNATKSRFELSLGDEVAVADYTLRGAVMTFTHTGVPTRHEGQGHGTRLAKFALDNARARGLTVVPRCPFIAAFIAQHSDYADLVAAPG